MGPNKRARQEEKIAGAEQALEHDMRARLRAIRNRDWAGADFHARSIRTLVNLVGRDRAREIERRVEEEMRIQYKPGGYLPP
jgi:hypothetical protein